MHSSGELRLLTGTEATGPANTNNTGDEMRKMCLVRSGCMALCLQLGGIVLGSPAFVQERDNQVNSGQTNSATFSAPATSGNLLAVYLIWDSTGSASVSDSLGNSYASAVAPIRWNNGAYSAQIFYTVSLRSGTDTVTATFTSSIKSFGIVYAHEYRGVSQTSPIDVTAAASGASGSLNSGAATTTNPSDLIFAGGVSANSVTAAGSGYVARSMAHGNITEDTAVSVTGSYSATASHSGGAWAMQMVAFKGASSGTSDTTTPSVPTGLAGTPMSSSQINLSWTSSTDPDNTPSQLTYGVFRNGSRVATTAAGTASWVDTGLAASTSYSYTVSANDPAGNSSTQSAAMHATTMAANQTPSDTQPPTVSITSPPNGQAVSGVTTIAANATDNVGVAAVQFQLDGVNLGAQLTSAPYSTGWTTSQTPNGSHVLTAIAIDAAGNRSVSSGVTVTVNNSSGGRSYTTNFPLTENPISEGGNWTGGSTAGGNLWGNVQTTSGMAFGVSEPTQYGDPTGILTGSYGPNQTVQGTVKIVSTPTGNCCHEIELRLRMTVTANRISGYEAYCSAMPESYNQYCHIARWNGPNGSYCNIENSPAVTYVANGDVMKATISGTNPVAITLYKNGTPIVQASDSGGNCSPGGAAGPFTSGNPGIGFYDNVDTNWSKFGFSSFTASDGSSGSTDTTPPSTPANLSATVISPSQINLSWSASTDNVGVASYEVFRNGSQITTTTQTSFSDTTVVPGVQYTYAVAAMDAAGNTSSQSVPVTIATSSGTDSTPPSIPTNLQSSNVSSTSLTVTWSSSTDNVAVAGYRVYRNGTQVGTTAAASYNDTNLVASTTYTYTVAAYDTSNNVSAQSNQLLVTTSVAAMMPPAFVQVSHNQISAGSSTPVNFSIATRPGNTIVVYVIWNNAGAASVTDSAGNSFASVSAPVSWGSGNSAQIFYAKNISGGADTVTATFQTPVTSFGVVYAHEYSGIDKNNPVDVTVSASGSSASLNSGSVTTTSANDLIFGAGVSDNSVTAAGSGFISRDLSYGNITEDRAAAAIGSYAATATHNGQKWAMQMVAFRAAQ
jgi:chitodextrinase